MHLISQTLMGLASVALAEAPVAEDGAVGMGGGLIEMLLPMVLMIGVFYFLLIRPQRKKDKKAKAMLAALKVGDRVNTIGGIYGTITSIKDDTIELSVGKENVKLIFARWAIQKVSDVDVTNDSEVLN